MAKKRPELDVDNIQSRPLTEHELAKITAFIHDQHTKTGKRGKKPLALDFIIDKLTHSIVNTKTGDSFETEVTPFTKTDAGQITKKASWSFNWKAELNYPEKAVYKLTIAGNLDIIQGLISISVQPDHVVMHLLESAPFNIGKGKAYDGVAGNLVAYACRLAFQHGFDGYVMFFAKTRLMAHYQQTLGATPSGGQRMIIGTAAARILVERYFKDK